MLTLTLTSDPACRTFPSTMPNAFALNIFSTAVKPGFCAKSLGMERILTSFLSQIVTCKTLQFLTKNNAVGAASALINSIFAV